MRVSPVQSFIKTMPRQPYLCHEATLAVLRHVHGDKVAHLRTWFALATLVEESLPKARRIPPTTGINDETNLFSVLAVQDFSLKGSLCHTAVLIDVEGDCLVAEALQGSTSIATLSLRQFMLREARWGHAMYLLQPELLFIS